MQLRHAGCVLVASLLAFVALAPRAQAVVIAGGVSVDYDGASADNTVFTFSNTSGFTFTNVMLTGVGTSGAINGITGTRTFADILDGTSKVFTFDNVATTGSGSVFKVDFDDTFTGNVTYTFSALANGVAVSSTFSPETNITAGFVPFLGNGPGGGELDQVTGVVSIADVIAAGPLVAAVGTPLPLAIFGVLPLGALFGAKALKRKGAAL